MYKQICPYCGKKKVIEIVNNNKDKLFCLECGKIIGVVNEKKETSKGRRE